MNASNDDDLFLKVAQELARKWVDEALWTKAYALENGDESKTKAHYIRLRVEQLKTTQSNTQQNIAQDKSEHSRNEQDYVVESGNKAKERRFVPATAWQRFWARSIDLLICTILVQFIPLKDELLTNIWLVVIVGFLLSGVVLVIYDGLLTSVFGATIGKMIAGIRVQKVDGSYPDFGLAVRRAFNVLVSGNWLYTFYPVSQLFLWPRLYKEFKKTGTTTWDEKAGTVVIQMSLNKTRDLIVGIVGLICLCSTLLVFQFIKQMNKSYIREVATDQTKISGASGASIESSKRNKPAAGNEKAGSAPQKETRGAPREEPRGAPWEEHQQKPKQTSAQDSLRLAVVGKWNCVDISNNYRWEATYKEDGFYISSRSKTVKPIAFGDWYIKNENTLVEIEMQTSVIESKVTLQEFGNTMRLESTWSDGRAPIICSRVS